MAHSPTTLRDKLERSVQKRFGALQARLDARTVKRDGCWEWIGTVTPKGYGQMSVGGSHTYVHRIAWELANGAPTGGRHVCHTCDNRVCVNPAHLFIGTNADNRADSVAKHRHAHGVRHGSAKLTAETVVAIREARATGLPYKALVAQFGVPFKTIEKVCTGATWRSAGGPIGPQPRTKRGPYARSPERGPDGRFHA